jgi:drug/metabolite transporter (DMT)-like permease
MSAPASPSDLNSVADGRATSSPRNQALLALSFAAVYIIWGSTYFAIRVGVESFPPFLLAGLRHFTVGLVFFPLFRYVTKEKPSRAQWRTTAITGVLLLLCGNGTVSWAEKYVPSGIAALLVATVSIWMVLADWFRPGGSRPVFRVLLGCFLGFVGVVLLVDPGHLVGSERIYPFGAFALTLAAMAWGIGSVYSKHNPIPHSPMLGVAMQMLAGGGALMLVAVLAGEFRNLHWAQISTRSWIALVYLVIMGSGVGFSGYVYILKHSTAARVSTYAFVNPAVALFLGWLLGGERLTLRTFLASAIILASVFLVITAPHRSPTQIEDSVPAPGEA